jgi:hypothetical protein
VDDDMLEEISLADYGQDGAEHLHVLRDIRDWGRVPAPIAWVPREVLELFRWSEPEDPEWRPGSPGSRGHLMRAFSCAVLLRAALEPENREFVYGENSTLAQLVSSALVLGPEVQVAAARFLAWRIPTIGPDEERPFFAFALLFLAVVLREGRFAGDTLTAAAEWVLAEEQEDFQVLYPEMLREGAPWLLRLTFFDQRDEVWRSFAERLLAEAPSLAPPARDSVHLVAEALLGR